MISAVKRNKVMITITLMFILLVLGIAVLITSGVINEKHLKDNKETVSFLFECAKLVMLITGGIIAYLRFFKGHQFMAQLDFTIDHKNVMVSDAKKIHFFDIVICNIGDYSVYNPVVKVFVTYIPDVLPSDAVLLKDGHGWINDHGKKVNEVLRAKTPMSLLYELTVDNIAVVAIKFEVVIELYKRTWRKTLIVNNKVLS